MFLFGDALAWKQMRNASTLALDVGDLVSLAQASTLWANYVRHIWPIVFEHQFSFCCPFHHGSKDLCLGLANETESSRWSPSVGQFCVLGGVVFRRGGRVVEESHLNAFDFRTKTWSHYSEVNATVVGRSSMAVCALPGRSLAVLGGFHTPKSRPVGNCEKISMDISTDVLPSLNLPRACCAAQYFGDCLMAIGGGTSMFNDAKATASTEILLDGASEWDFGPSLNQVRIAPGACQWRDGQTFVVGGFGGGNQYLKSTEYLANERFVNGPSMICTRSGPCCLVSQFSDIWAIAGGQDAFNNCCTCERLDPREGKWSVQLHDTRLARRCFASAFCGHSLVLYGGWIATEWHISTMCMIDIRKNAVVTWIDMPSLLYGAPKTPSPIIPYQFVSGAFLI
eukprot:GEMP01009958.1.p1 GENE.GEMP01009958.1~~GEMP01009958.1.p1  ORF type:complete len:396 (+),score=54.30 GEMP01009958.1:68-1255(+)